MKKTLTKLLVCILITLILTNYCMTNVAYAGAMEVFTSFANGVWGVVVEFIEDIMGTVVGIFAIIPKIIVLPLALSAQSFMATIAYSQGTSDADGNIKNATILNADTWFLTPFDILFNKVALVDVNIFNIPNTPGAIKSIREAAAGWYYVMRNIAAAILLCVLIYVGIRMALSTIASDKAAYKKMLVDWVASLALIFLLQYIIVFTFAINTAFIKALESVSKAEGVSSAILKLYASALWVDIDSIAATIVICMLTWQTMSLLISYISRMLKVTFLVIISPLITLTYSIDKMGDGKAQALNTWLKEFIYTVLLQPFHCIIYTAFIGIALELLGRPLPLFEFDNNNVGAAVLCILCIHFTKEAEKILGKIFNFADSTSGASLATGMAATAIVASNAKNIGRGARSLANGAKNVRNFASNAAVTLGTMGAVMKGEDAEKARARVAENVRSFNDNIDSSVKNVKDSVSGAAQGLLIGTAARFATARSMKKEDQEKIKAKAEDINKSSGMPMKEAMAHARKEVADENRKNKTERKETKKAEREERKRNISNAVTYWKNSDTAKQLKQDVIPSIISAGAGVFVGAGSFGVGGNAVQSIMLGTATSKGTGEFFKTSTNRLAEENAKLIEGSGARTKEEAMAYLGQIAGREDQFKDAANQLDSIYSDILAACDGLDGKQKNQVRGSLKNIIDSTLMKNPAATDTDIMDAINQNGILQGLNIKDGKADDFQNGILEAIDFQRGAKVYENMSNVTSWGLKPEVMMDDTIKRFQPSNSGVSNDTYENLDNNSPQNNSPQNAPENTTTTQESRNEETEETEEIVVQDMSSNLPPEIVEQLKIAEEEQVSKIEEIIDTYESLLDEGYNHLDATRIAEERHLDSINEENQGLVRQIIENEKFMTKLKEENYSLQGVIKVLRRARGG